MKCQKHEWVRSAIHFSKPTMEPDLRIRTITLVILVCIHCLKVRNVE